MMNLLSILRDDHAGILKIIDSLRNEHDALRARELCDAFCDAVELHTRLETDIAFPEVKSWLAGRARELLATDRRRHELVLELLEKVRNGPFDVTRDERLREAMKALEDHFVEEEQELFPEIERKLPVYELERQGERLDRRRQELSGESVRVPAVA